MSTAPNLGQAEGTALLVAGALALVAVLYVVKRGPGQVAADAGKAAAGAVVAAAGGVATGVADAGSGALGIPTTEQTTTDPSVARWLIDNYGYLDASEWSGAPALLKGAWMEAGTGTPPPAGSPVALAHPTNGVGGAFDYGATSNNPGGW
jgi:hypothetical protein